MRGLTATGRTAAWAAAVVGDPFDAGLARTVAGLDEDGFPAALDELAGAGLVAPTGKPWRFRFRHPIVRRAVYESAGPGWRRAAHARAAAALERPGSGPLARARHVERSAEVGDRAAVDLLAAAGHAAAATAPAEAAHWFEVALALLPAGGGDRRHRELLRALAFAAGAAGRLADSAAAVDTCSGS